MPYKIMESSIYPIDDNIQVEESFLNMSTDEDNEDQNVIGGDLMNGGNLLLTRNAVNQLINVGENLIEEPVAENNFLSVSENLSEVEPVVVHPLTVCENLTEEPAARNPLITIGEILTEVEPVAEDPLITVVGEKLNEEPVNGNLLLTFDEDLVKVEPVSPSITNGENITFEPVFGNSLVTIDEKFVSNVKTESDIQPILGQTEISSLPNGEIICTSSNTFRDINRFHPLFPHITMIKPELSSNDYLEAESKSKRKSRKQKTPIKTRLTENGDIVSDKYVPVTVVSSVGIFHNDNNMTLPPQHETSIESFLNQFVTKQNTLPAYEIFQTPTKKKSPKKPDQIYQCEQCNKTFSYKCNLLMHAAVHSSEKTHTCSICNKSFKLKGHLDTHRKVHEERYEYRCDLCGKEFKLKGNVKTHIRTKHLEERSHPCPHCHMSFKLKQHLMNHLRIKHDTISLQSMSLVKLKEI